MWIERDKSGEFNHQKWEIQESNICIKHQENMWLIWDVSSKHHGDFPGISKGVLGKNGEIVHMFDQQNWSVCDGKTS
jgi:hypothetical protein